MEEKIDIKRFYQIIKRRMLTIIITTLCVSLLTAGVALYVMKPTYEATENILVGNLKKDANAYGETQELSMLLASTIDFINSPIVLNSVKKELKISDETLDEKISVQSTRDSQIVKVTVRDHDLEGTKLLAHTLAVTSVNKMNDLFGVTDIKVLSDESGDSSIKKIGSTTLNVGIGVVIGLFLGIGLSMFREYLDDSVKESEEIETLLGLRVLGEINLKEKQPRSLRKMKATQQYSDEINKKNRGELSV
jgi:capsular polysaccharide biosynthesis protein